MSVLKTKTLLLCILTSGFLAFTGCEKSLEDNGPDTKGRAIAKPPKLTKDFEQVNLVASTEGYSARRIDPMMINPWGIAVSPGGVFWPASQGTGLSQLFTSEGVQVRPAVIIPGPFTPDGGNPTGIVFNSSSDFRLKNGNPARFIFAGLDGVISGWNSGDFAERKFAEPGVSVYTGLAIANDGTGNFLYAADFKAGTIDVFNTNYEQVSKPFVDPALPEGYSPFNIQNLEGKLYVMYAKVGPDGRDEAGPGNGYVNIFNPDGTLVGRFASRGGLNAPWGISKAPATFYGEDNLTDRPVGGTILVGNFGDGRIHAYDLEGNELGQLRAHGQPVVIDGLWAITFPPATATAVDPNRLYFAAGPNHERDGLFGYLAK